MPSLCSPSVNRQAAALCCTLLHSAIRRSLLATSFAARDVHRLELTEATMAIFECGSCYRRSSGYSHIAIEWMHKGNPHKFGWRCLRDVHTFCGDLRASGRRSEDFRFGHRSTDLSFIPTVPAAAGKRERPDRDFRVRGLICRRRRQKVAGGLHGGSSQRRISIRKRSRKQDLGHFLVRRLPSRPPRSSLSFEDINGERKLRRSGR